MNSLKETNIRKFPEDWGFDNVRSACNILTGFPFNSKLFNEEKGLPLIRIRDLSSSTTETLYSGDYSEEYLVRLGDILTGMDGDFIPSKWKGPVGLLNQRVCKIAPKDKTEFEEDFVYYQLYDELKKINQSTARTTVKHLSTKDFSRMYLVRPPLPEQKKIASVLTTADGAIEKTNVIIEQSKQVKKGLMQDLLTRGIGHKKFKETELGEVPEEWKILNFDKATVKSHGDFKKLKTNLYQKNGEYPIIDQGRDKIAGYTDDKEALYRGELPVIIFGDHTLFVKYIDFPFAVGADGTKIIHANNSEFEPKFLFYVIESLSLKSEGYKRHFGLLREQSFIKPIKEEQKYILSVLTTADAKIEEEVQKRGQFETLKKGLMQDLLTGHVRFPEFVKGAN